MGINRLCGCGRGAMRSINVQRRTVKRKDEKGELVIERNHRADLNMLCQLLHLGPEIHFFEDSEMGLLIKTNCY